MMQDDDPPLMSNCGQSCSHFVNGRALGSCRLCACLSSRRLQLAGTTRCKCSSHATRDSAVNAANSHTRACVATTNVVQPRKCFGRDTTPGASAPITTTCSHTHTTKASPLRLVLPGPHRHACTAPLQRPAESLPCGSCGCLLRSTCARVCVCVWVRWLSTALSVVCLAVTPQVALCHHNVALQPVLCSTSHPLSGGQRH